MASCNAVLKLKTPWRNGATHIVLTPMEFMQRLEALVPRPRLHLIRFHGVLAPNAKLRSQVVLIAERTACRRLISLICAGWLPYDNRFVGELPRSIVEGHSVAGRIIGIPRILPPLPILLPTHCMIMICPLFSLYAFAAGCGDTCPIAQIKPASSRAIAVLTCTFILPRASKAR